MKEPWTLFNMLNSCYFKKAGKDVDYYVLQDHKDLAIYLFLAPTNSNADWKTNFDFPVKLYKNQEGSFLVTRGWRNAWRSANDVIMGELIAAYNDNPQYQVTICGWSYGGAMALLAAEDWHYRMGWAVNRVVTWGAPNPLWGKKSREHFKWACGNTMRAVPHTVQYAHSGDIVPLLPPLPGYCGVDKTILDKKSWWKFWRIFNPWKWHTIYGEENYYKL